MPRTEAKDNKKVSVAEAKAQKAAEEAAKAAAEAKRLAQAGFVTGLKKTNRPGAKQLLEEYQKLDRFDEEKTVLLNKYQQDKSLKWVTEYFETKTETMKQTQDGASGFCTDYVIADLLKMKREDPIFKTVISKIPCEEADTWDEDDMVQAGYKLAGLKRYRLDTVNTLLKKQKVQENSSSSSTSTTLGRNSGPLALGGASSSVKVEVKAYVQLQADAKIVSAAEKKFAKMLNDLKGCKATLVVSAKPGKEQLESLKKLIAKLEDLSEDAMTFMAMVDAVDQGCEKDIEILTKQIEDKKVLYEDHLDAAKLVLTKTKNYINSL